MPLFSNSTNNIIPEVDTNEIPSEEIPKPDEKRRLSFKKSFFTWSSQKHYIDKNKFLFDSYSVISTKEKKNSQNSYIIKSNKYATSNSSLNYDESENEYSSGSDINEETSPKDYYSMEDLDNITALKPKPPKIRKVAQLSESTLCYSSNTNTINTVSLEFSIKNKSITNNNENGGIIGETINYGLEENPNNEEATNIGLAENQNNEGEEKIMKNTNTINTVSLEFNGKNKSIINNENGGIEGETINYGFEEKPNIEEATNIGFTENLNNDGEEKIMKNINDISEEYNDGSIDSSDDEDDDSFDEDEDDELSDPINNLNNIKSFKKSTPNNNSVKKTVTFCDDVVIIEPRKQQKTINLFRKAMSMIIRKKNEQNKEVI